MAGGEDSERVNLVRGMVSSVEGSSGTPATELYTDDARLFIPHGIDAGVHRGREEVAHYWREQFEIWARWQGEIDWIDEVGDSVQAVGTMTVESVGGVPGKWRWHYAAYFQGSRIAAAVFYADWMSGATPMPAGRTRHP